MPAVAHTDWTVDMLDALPDDDQRYEIIDGELFVTPAPRLPHQLVLNALNVRIYSYLLGKGVGRVLVAPSDVRRGDRTRNRVQPDIFDGVPPAWTSHSSLTSTNCSTKPYVSGGSEIMR